MKPRHPADYRTLLWAFVFFPMVPAIAYARPTLGVWLLPFALWLAYLVGVIAHNHNHHPVFTGRHMNTAFGAWLSFFYGAPLSFWIPTHNLNHHRHRNGPGDATRTSRFATRDRWLDALAYPSRSTAVQLPVIADFARRMYRQSARHFRQLLLQAAALILGHALSLYLAIALHGAVQGSLTYALVIGLPALFAPWAMMFTNYLQHVGCDPTSPDRHSRNFVNPTLNWLLFNAGYHTVHHEHPQAHWSLYRELHRERSAAIGPDLNPGTLLGYCWEAYVVGARARSTVQIERVLK